MPKPPVAEMPPSLRSLRAGMRGTIDAIVQGSLVELFAAYSVALAPLPRTHQVLLPTATDICAGITFTQERRAGRVALYIPSALLDDMDRGAPTTSLRGDWVRELSNQLLGRIKNRLLPFDVRLGVGSSSVLDAAQAAERLGHSTSTRAYAARTRRGQVLAHVEGLPEDSELTYIGTAHAALEGDAILF